MTSTKPTILAAAALACALSLQLGVAAPSDSGALDIARQLNQAFIEVADKASRSVVVIRVLRRPEAIGRNHPLWDWLPDEMRRRFEDAPRGGGRPDRRHPLISGQGSGIVIRESGYILTNQHVVEGAEKITVRLRDGTLRDAEIRGVDVQSDIAVLKIEEGDLRAARFADSNKVKVGEFAIAIGAPFELDYTVTVGHVSAKGRGGLLPDQSMDEDFIQTDASINPGNSGGPLVNLDGDIIGINTLIRGLQTGIGFAIPSNLAKEVADQLIEKGKFTRAWLGVEIATLRDDVEMRSLLRGVDDGVVIRGILRDGPSFDSDLRLGDVIVAVDGREVSTGLQLKNEIRSKAIGEPVTLAVVRKGKRVEVVVRPEAWPEELIAAEMRRRSTPEALESEDLGIVVRSLTPDLAKEYRVDIASGLVVTAVSAGSEAARKGVAPGDVITEVNQEAVTDLREFGEALRDADLDRGVLLNVVRGGVTRLVVLKTPGE